MKKYLLLIIGICSLFVARAQLIFSVADFGAVPDGKTNNAEAIQQAIDSCARMGGGQIRFSAPGTYLSGPLELRSNMEYFFEAAAVLKASPDEALYTASAFRENVGEGMMWLYGKDLENISFSGTGAIDGNGIAFMGPEEEDAYQLKPFTDRDPRPHVLTLIGCRNIRLHDLRIGNAAYWTIHLAGCKDVVIEGITLLNSLKVRNSDGIDIDHSKNVRITDCHIESGDDCICLKNRREYQEFGACEDITVSNCIMTSRSCAFKIGSENMDTIRRVLVNNCIIKNSNRGIGIQNRDEGVVTDVQFSNMFVEGRLFSDVWWGKAEPIYVTAFRRASITGKDASVRFPPGAKEGRVGAVTNISFSNIECQSENGIFVSAESPDKLDNIRFDQVTVTLEKITGLPGGIYDRRPSQVEGFVKGTTAAFYIENAGAVTIRNTQVQWKGHLPEYFSYAIESHQVKKLTISGLLGTAAFPAKKKPVLQVGN